MSGVTAAMYTTANVLRRAANERDGHCSSPALLGRLELLRCRTAAHRGVVQPVYCVPLSHGIPNGIIFNVPSTPSGANILVEHLKTHPLLVKVCLVHKL